MKNHTHFEELLTLYAAGQLAGTERIEMENHLAGCAECQADLDLWLAVSTEIRASNQALAAPPALVERALDQVQAPGRLAGGARHAWELLRAQAFLARREMWPASAAVMALGVIVALLSRHTEAIYFIAPMVAVASLTELSGPARDPAYELILATPTSPWKVLLARLSIVSGYNLLLSLAATLALLVFVPPALLGALILGWLGPLAFLSALALLLSLWLGTSNAVAIAYVLWIAQYAPYQSIEVWLSTSAWTPVIQTYLQFWHSPLLLCLLSIFVVAMALWSASRPVFRLHQEAG